MTPKQVAFTIGAKGVNIIRMCRTIGGGLYITHDEEKTGSFKIQAWNFKALNNGINMLRQECAYNPPTKMSKTIYIPNMTFEFVSLLIGNGGENIKQLCQSVGFGCFVIHNNEKLGSFTIQAWTEEALNNAILLLREECGRLSNTPYKEPEPVKESNPLNGFDALEIEDIESDSESDTESDSASASDYSEAEEDANIESIFEETEYPKLSEKLKIIESDTCWTNTSQTVREAPKPVEKPEQTPELVPEPKKEVSNVIHMKGYIKSETSELFDLFSQKTIKSNLVWADSDDEEEEKDKLWKNTNHTNIGVIQKGIA